MSLSTEVPEKSVIKSTVIRLLEKAGRHPQLTPKILRSKVETKLQLEPKTLHPKKEYIKNIAITWWVDKSGDNDGDADDGAQIRLQRLNKVAIVSGAAPAIFKGTVNMSDKEKIVYLTEK